MLIKNHPFFCSWSGGKDSALALYRAIKEGGKPGFLLTILTEDNKRSRSHGLLSSLIEKQALALDIPLVLRAASWENYQEVFRSAISEFREQGIETGVFGDIDIEEHREWVRKVCFSASLGAYHPLWKNNRLSLLKQLFEVGFKATIIAIKDKVLDRRFLGKTLDLETIEEMEESGIDPSGEEGEYHTVVTDGPIFSEPLQLENKEQVLRNGYWFLDVSVGKNNLCIKST